MQESVNIFEAAPIEGRIDIGELAGSDETSAYVYDIDPGAASCPYHYEYVEEWLLVVSGEAAVRTPDGERSVSAGQLVRFPAGAAGAHKIANRGEVPCRVLMFSARRAPAVSVYPDSDKIGIWPSEDGADDGFFVRDTAVSWAHGEDDWYKA
ncbi:MAG TPA: cupin domain-containing protein [Solirubrobacteraceae bacterium]|nr:cupin domain-containing protein [Solirubrobacteraceae bacterium]